MSTPPDIRHGGVVNAEIGGWSAGSTRSNRNFLYSVDLPQLSVGVGSPFWAVSFTLTLRECPPLADTWCRKRKDFFRILRRAGALRIHWVTEWQRRGVPHLHGSVWLPKSEWELTNGVRGERLPWEYYFDPRSICPWELDPAPWLWLAEVWIRLWNREPSPLAQHGALIETPLGWAKYLAKHAARGLSHYQRSSEGIPVGWQGRTGRMWAKSGDWPIAPTLRFDIDRKAFHIIRRFCRNWVLADARSVGDRRRITWARGMLKCNNPSLSRVRGASEWLPQSVMLLVLGYLSGRGCRIESD